MSHFVENLDFCSNHGADSDVIDVLACQDCQVRDALEAARSEHRPHSLIATQRFWQPVAAAPGVVAWGYAYEGGQFNRPIYSRSAAHDAIARYIAEVSR